MIQELVDLLKKHGKDIKDAKAKKRIGEIAKCLDGTWGHVWWGDEDIIRALKDMFEFSEKEAKEAFEEAFDHVNEEDVAEGMTTDGWNTLSYQLSDFAQDYEREE